MIDIVSYAPPLMRFKYLHYCGTDSACSYQAHDHDSGSKWMLHPRIISRRFIDAGLKRKTWVSLWVSISAMMLFLWNLNPWTIVLSVTPDIAGMLDIYTPLPSHLTNSAVSRSNTLGPTVLVLIAHERVEYFSESLKSVLAARNSEQFTIAVSVDAPSEFAAFREAIKRVNLGNRPIEFWESPLPTYGRWFPYEAGVTRHLKVVMDRAFQSFEYTIVLEEDLTVSLDFFEYFQGTGQLIHPSNPSSRDIYCISAWNDQGFPHLALDESRVFRTNFYPGLGVMLHRSFWVNAMEKYWPFWRSPDWAYDWWLRRYTSLRDRYVLIPEVPRTHHISRRGLNVNANGALTYLRMVLASGSTPISDLSLSIASSQSRTRAYYDDIIHQSSLVSVADLDSAIATRRGESLLVIFDDDATPLDEMKVEASAELPKLLRKLGLFANSYRAFFQRAFSFRLKDGQTRITLVGSSMAYTYWGIPSSPTDQNVEV